MSEWIPCSERFPEEGVEVIAQRGYPDYKDIGISRYIGLRAVDWGFDMEMRHTWENDIWEDYSVIAWMSLPEPSEEIALAAKQVDEAARNKSEGKS